MFDFSKEKKGRNAAIPSGIRHPIRFAHLHWVQGSRPDTKSSAVATTITQDGKIPQKLIQYQVGLYRAP
jgi:hypothetical protein